MLLLVQQINTDWCKTPEQERKMFKLLVIYCDNTREEHEYSTREEAEKAAAGYRMAFGNQIQYIGIDRRGIYD